MPLAVEVVESMRQLQDLQHLTGLMEWDQMIRGSVDHAMRSRQEGQIVHLRYRLLQDDRLLDLVRQAEAGSENDIQMAMVRRLRIEVDRARAIPVELAQRFADTRSDAYGSWLQGRAGGDYGDFRELLQQLVDLRAVIAEHEGYQSEPYDACLNEFELNLSAGQMERIGTEVIDALRGLIDNIAHHDQTQWTARRDLLFAAGFRQYVTALMSRLGYDPARGAVAYSEAIAMHDVGPSDTRVCLSNRIAGDPFRYIRELAHEVGHALYAQGLPIEWSETTVGDAPSVGLHESQALLWEQHVARSREFWIAEGTSLAQHFGPLQDKDAEWLYRACNRVSMTPDAAEADELSYCLHSAIRFQMERLLIRKEVAVVDLPGVSDELYQRYLGVPGNTDRIVFQEIAWSRGYFGYVPVYLVGRIYAATLFRRIEDDFGGDEVRRQVQRGEYTELRMWLHHHVYSRAGLSDARDLITELSGSDPWTDTTPYVAHLQARYADF